MNINNLTILPGGGSPYSQVYSPVYDLIMNHAKSKGIDFTLLDYIGIGQHPDLGDGLDLSKVINKIRNCIYTEIKDRTLFCKSFGCDVASFFLANEPELLKNYNQIILWGASPFHHQWELFAKEDINDTNNYLIKKGLKISNRYFTNLIPIEYQAKCFSSTKHIKIGCGTEDMHCSVEFCKYLSSIINKHTSCHATISIIDGAPHSVTSQNSKKLVDQYLDFIFT